MIATKDKFFLLPLIFLLMSFMISDYKVLCNLVGSATTLLLLFYTSKSWGTNYYDRKNTQYYLLFLIYYSITSFLNFEAYSWFTYLLYYLILFCPFVLYRYIEQQNNISLVKWIIVIFFIIWTAFCLICTKSCLDTPDLARMMAAFRPSYKDVINGGGYPMGYGAAILSGYLFYLIINGKVKSFKWRLFIYGELALMLFMVSIINSFIILVGLLIGYGINIVNKIAQRTKSAVSTYIVLGVVAIILYVFIGDILLFMANNTTDDFWHKRWMETYNSIVMGSNSNHVDDRQLMYNISINSFLQNPIFGVGYKFGNVFSLGDLTFVGNHSTLFDTLAQYGIIGAIPVFLYLLYPYKSNKRKGYDSSYLIPFAFMACLNPIFSCFHAMVIVYLIIPLMQIIEHQSDYN